MKQLLYFIECLFIFYTSHAFALNVEVASSFNPVGAGGRGVGMGSYIAIGDDTPSPLWNPAAPIQMEEPFEVSWGVSIVTRKEKIKMAKNPDGNGNHRISNRHFDFLGMVSTFEKFEKNMSFSLAYQHLYDFNRNWTFPYNETAPIQRHEQWSYEQSGSLSALGLTYSIELIRACLSFGLTFNIWDDSISPNQWTQYYHMSGDGQYGSNFYTVTENKREEYTFDGYNFNLGLLWIINHQFSVGAILKTPFNADIKHVIQSTIIHKEDSNVFTIPTHKTYNEQLKMPLSYGIGMVYKYSDLFYLSADIYKTHWNRCLYTDAFGIQTSIISNYPIEKSNVKPTYQVRMGGEYLLINKNNNTAIPLRAGIFYDPAPAEKNPDDFYGFSLGTGYIKNNIAALELAYVYRFGNNAASTTLESVGFSEDVQEHLLYISLIKYFY
jgi:long-subunit fatty acid transport protein